VEVVEALMPLKLMYQLHLEQFTQLLLVQEVQLQIQQLQVVTPTLILQVPLWQKVVQQLQITVQLVPQEDKQHLVLEM
jgi:hypothetical protein